MKKRKDTNRLLAAFSTTALIALLLLSPCKVRNAIQAAFDLEQTDVLNKSQATITASSCSAFEQLQIKNTTAKVLNDFTFATVTLNTTVVVRLFATADKLVFQDQKKSKSFRIVPYYILYQSLRAYL